jgi:hypothetical protein
MVFGGAARYKSEGDISLLLPGVDA